MCARHWFILQLLFFILIVAAVQNASCVPASSFTFKNGDWYDNFGINRNYYGGPHGFLPNLVYETIGDNKELAYSIGEKFREKYTGVTERAVAILRYVQRWTEYGYDSENVVVKGVPQEEWAWNADEMAHNFSDVTGVRAVGDCEDLAFLCGTIYLAAGFDVAIVEAPEHAALLIWLPEFPNANMYWDLPNDGRDAGWIWVESTGDSNPLGWTPPDFEDGGWTAYIIGSSGSAPPETIPYESTSIDLEILLAIVFIILSIMSALAKSKSKR